MDNQICTHNKQAPVNVLRTLHYSQGGTGRHRCAICSYSIGFAHGSNGRKMTDENIRICSQGSKAPYEVLFQLPDYQGKSARHKCTICSYQQGYLDGLDEQIKQTTASIVSDTLGTEDEFSVNQTNVGKLTEEQPSKTRPSGSNIKTQFKGRKGIDYSNLDRQNRLLGKAGEKLVLYHEISYLKMQDREDLSKMVVHISEVEGDGAGYDIKSFMPDGITKLIEVKTTTGAKNTDFYLSFNECEFAKQNRKYYYLYRVFDFDKKTKNGKYFQIHGAIDNFFRLTPTQFKVSPI